MHVHASWYIACTYYWRFSYRKSLAFLWFSSECLRLMGFSRARANLSWLSIRSAHYTYPQRAKLTLQERTNTIQLLEYFEHM